MSTSHGAKPHLDRRMSPAISNWLNAEDDVEAWGIERFCWRFPAEVSQVLDDSKKIGHMI